MARNSILLGKTKVLLWGADDVGVRPFMWKTSGSGPTCVLQMFAICALWFVDAVSSSDYTFLCVSFRLTNQNLVYVRNIRHPLCWSSHLLLLHALTRNYRKNEHLCFFRSVLILFVCWLAQLCLLPSGRYPGLVGHYHDLGFSLFSSVQVLR